jgi:hypothetical protein
MKNGDKTTGQLLKLSQNAIIVEVITENKKVSTVSFERKLVQSVVDESGTLLYANNRLHVTNLERYYQKMFVRQNPKRAKVDTLVFKSGYRAEVHLLGRTVDEISYRKKDDPKTTVRRAKVSKIDTLLENINDLNDKPVHQYYSEPISRNFSYPSLELQIGIALIQHSLNDHQDVTAQLAEESGNLNMIGPRKIGNPFISVEFGLGPKFTPNIIATLVANFVFNSGNNKDHKEESEFYRLFFAELRYAILPEYNFCPWLGVGYAMQSITIINNYGRVDLNFKAKSKTISLAGGLIISPESSLSGLIAIRYLPFGEKEIENIIPSSETKIKNKIDFSSLMISTSLIMSL